jgi:hypothetical protein
MSSQSNVGNSQAYGADDQVGSRKSLSSPLVINLLLSYHSPLLSHSSHRCLQTLYKSITNNFTSALSPNNRSATTRASPTPTTSSTQRTHAPSRTNSQQRRSTSRKAKRRVRSSNCWSRTPLRQRRHMETSRKWTFFSKCRAHAFGRYCANNCHV